MSSDSERSFQVLWERFLLISNIKTKYKNFASLIIFTPFIENIREFRETYIRLVLSLNTLFLIHILYWNEPSNLPITNFKFFVFIPTFNVYKQKITFLLFVSFFLFFVFTFACLFTSLVFFAGMIESFRIPTSMFMCLLMNPGRSTDLVSRFCKSS